jgi:geranylgeranyl pyrophosphate synthase
MEKDHRLDTFLAAVRRQVELRLAPAAVAGLNVPDLGSLVGGKMLRSRLAGRLIAAAADDVDCGMVRDACAAVEMVHAASLCHDDLIDKGLIRRGRGALWTVVGPATAVLMGDLLLCQAVELVSSHREILKRFMARVRDMLRGEIEQEVVLQSLRGDGETCLRIARGKTGAMFAFAAWVCGGSRPGLADALEECGYRIGTAYQLGDDLIDLHGSEIAAGKTLGTDRHRGNRTLPQLEENGRSETLERIAALCNSSLGLVSDYPRVQASMKDFLSLDLQPVLDECLTDCVPL